ncbi:MAG: NAD-dependent epimerase/dehydratase family protein [Bacteroidales bacterium]|nr:NAD-dependent epimerase/dehydratase family protein [Bacteroidales bacterium]MCF8454456.1 NAD-dependent epimerase/dehydratase family protein [Bacteroidales bacterium]
MGKIDLKGKKVLVTGGNGYLGRNLVASLREAGAKVFILDKNGDETLENTFILDITDRELLTKAIHKIQPDIVFHLAASLNRDRDFDNFDEIHSINFDGTLNLLMALQNVVYENFIFASTSEIYGSNEAPFVESQIPDPASPYSLTKVFSENLIKTFSKTYDKKFTILRIFNFFGKGMSPQFFIPQMMNSLRNNTPFEMTEGEQKRDFLYLDDILEAMLLCASHTARNETFNVCSGEAVTLKQLVLEMKLKLNSKSEIMFGALPYRSNEVWNMVGDNSKIRESLGFVPKYNLGKGIELIIS